MDRLPGADLAVDFPQDVEQLARHLRLFVGAPVAQEVVELLQTLFIVSAVALEGDGDRIIPVRVLERQSPGFPLGDRILQADAAEEKEQRRHSKPTGNTGSVGEQA